MTNQKKKTRWDFLNIKIENKEELTQRFGSIVNAQSPAHPIEEITKKAGETLYQDFLERIYSKKVAKISEEKGIEVKKPNPFINWFQNSSQRMLTGLTGAWMMIIGFFFLLLGVFKSNASFGEIVGILALYLITGIFWGYFLGYITVTIVPRLMVSFSDKRGGSTWPRFMLGIFVLFWYWIYGLIPRKAFEIHFYKFTKLYKGIRFCEEEKYHKAISELKEYKPQKADIEENIIYYSTLGECYLNIGEMDKAVTAYQKLVDFAPDELEAKLTLAYVYILSDKHDEGLLLLRELREKFPENSEILMIMARSYLNLGMFDEALAILTEARAINPMNPITHKMLAEGYLGKGMKKEAIESANKAISLNAPPKIKEEAREIINCLS